MSTFDRTRRTLIKTMGLGAAALAMPKILPAAKESGDGEKKPNVLFIAVDDLRPQIHCYGHKQMISPYMDSLASEGVIFSRAYCQVPVCGASRASLLTGIRPTRDRFVNWYVWADKDAPGTVSLPMHFKNNEYHTLSNGKVYHHLNDGEGSWSEQPWRSDAERDMSDPGSNWMDYLLEENKNIAKENNGRGEPFERPDVPDNAYRDGILADKAISDLRRLKYMDKPFFLALGFFKPHLPFNAPAKYWDLYKREEIDLADNPFRPKGAPDAALHNWGELRQFARIPQEGPLSEEMARTLIHGYYACVSYTDAQIGRVLDELERLGLKDDTIIVLWGDHGWNLGEHGLWCKHCNFETALCSPLIVSAPGIQGGTKTNALTEFVDIYPSLCDLCSLPIPFQLDGASFVPVMKDPDSPGETAAFSRYQDGDSVRTDRYRYTEWRNDNGEVYARMLYDHHTDPAENVNISELPENRELIKQLSRMIQKLP
ncbi:MAG: sulfatase [bacterium]